MSEPTDLSDLVAHVAAAYFTGSKTRPDEIPAVIQSIASALSAINSAPSESEPPTAEPPTRKTSAQLRKSITPDALISFEDNRSYKTLKRHLTARGLTPAAYRDKHGLPSDYPMVTASYSATRREMALSRGLGQKGGAGRKVGKGTRGGPKPAVE